MILKQMTLLTIPTRRLNFQVQSKVHHTYFMSYTHALHRVRCHTLVNLGLFKGKELASTLVYYQSKHLQNC